MQENINKLFKLIGEPPPVEGKKDKEWFIFLTTLANRIWTKGIVTKEISDILDMLFSILIGRGKKHENYTEWMMGRTGTSRPEGINSFYDICFKHATIPKEARILDVGTRRGLGLDLLNKQGYKNICGIELCKETAEECKKFPVDIGDIHNSSYGSQMFNLVIIRGVLEHCCDQRIVLKELYRILKSEGYIFYGFPTEIAFAWRNCRRITLELFFKWIHEIGFISTWVEGKEKIDTKNPLYHGSIIGILQKR